MKVLKTIACVLAGVFLFFFVINVIPPKKSAEENPFLVEAGALPMIAAHRGGGACNPENTLLAFYEAVDIYGVDILEGDLHLTKDGHLVFNHDDYIDETCNVNGDISFSEVRSLCSEKKNRHYVSDMTLEELRTYNFGYYFTDKNGKRPYKEVANAAEMGLQIATLEQVFDAFYESDPALLFIVEIKDGGERGAEACRALDALLEKYPNYRDRIVVGSFFSSVEKTLKESYPDIYRGASTVMAANFIVTQTLRVNLFSEDNFHCLQIPASFNLGVGKLGLAKETYVDRAHERNIAVQYWIDNDEDTVRRLIEIGCDCIMTDDPAFLKKIFEEYQSAQ